MLVGNISIRVTADLKDFSIGVAAAQRQVESLTASVAKLSAAIKTVPNLGAVVGLGGRRGGGGRAVAAGASRGSVGGYSSGWSDLGGYHPNNLIRGKLPKYDPNAVVWAELGRSTPPVGSGVFHTAQTRMLENQRRMAAAREHIYQSVWVNRTTPSSRDVQRISVYNPQHTSKVDTYVPRLPNVERAAAQAKLSKFGVGQKAPIGYSTSRLPAVVLDEFGVGKYPGGGGGGRSGGGGRAGGFGSGGGRSMSFGTLASASRTGMIGASIYSAFVSAPIIAGIKEMVDSFTQVEDQLYGVNTIAKLNNKEFEIMTYELLGMSSAIGVGPQEMSESLYEIYQATYQGSQAMDILQASTQAAVGGMADAKSVTEGIVSVMQAYSSSNLRANDVADIMFMGVQRGIVTFQQFATHIGKVVATSASLGVSFEEVSAAIATMTRGGVRPQEAFTALNTFLQRMLSPTKQLKMLFASTAEGTTTAMVRNRGLAGTMEFLTTATGGTAEGIKALGFRIRDFRAAAQLTRNMGKDFADDIATVGDRSKTAGASIDAFNERNKSLHRQFERMRTSISVMNFMFGEAFKPTIMKLTIAIERFAFRMATLSEPVKKAIGWMFILAAAIGPITILLFTASWMFFGLANGVIALATSLGLIGAGGIVAALGGWATIAWLGAALAILLAIPIAIAAISYSTAPGDDPFEKMLFSAQELTMAVAICIVRVKQLFAQLSTIRSAFSTFSPYSFITHKIETGTAIYKRLTKGEDSLTDKEKMLLSPTSLIKGSVPGGSFVETISGIEDINDKANQEIWNIRNAKNPFLKGLPPALKQLQPDLSFLDDLDELGTGVDGLGTGVQDLGTEAEKTDRKLRHMMEGPKALVADSAEAFTSWIRVMREMAYTQAGGDISRMSRHRKGGFGYSTLTQPRSRGEKEEKPHPPEIAEMIRKTGGKMPATVQSVVSKVKAAFGGAGGGAATVSGVPTVEGAVANALGLPGAAGTGTAVPKTGSPLIASWDKNWNVDREAKTQKAIDKNLDRLAFGREILKMSREKKVLEDVEKSKLIKPGFVPTPGTQVGNLGDYMEFVSAGEDLSTLIPGMGGRPRGGAWRQKKGFGDNARLSPETDIIWGEIAKKRMAWEEGVHKIGLEKAGPLFDSYAKSFEDRPLEERVVYGPPTYLKNMGIEEGVAADAAWAKDMIANADIAKRSQSKKGITSDAVGRRKGFMNIYGDTYSQKFFDQGMGEFGDFSMTSPSAKITEGLGLGLEDIQYQRDLMDEIADEAMMGTTFQTTSFRTPEDKMWNPEAFRKQQSLMTERWGLRQLALDPMMSDFVDVISGQIDSLGVEIAKAKASEWETSVEKAARVAGENSTDIANLLTPVSDELIDWMLSPATDAMEEVKTMTPPTVDTPIPIESLLTPFPEGMEGIGSALPRTTPSIQGDVSSLGIGVPMTTEQENTQRSEFMAKVMMKQNAYLAKIKDNTKAGVPLTVGM